MRCVLTTKRADQYLGRVSDGSKKRAARVAQLLQHALSELTVQGLRDPRIGLVTITEVRLSDDLRSAKVFVSSFGNAEERSRSLAGLKAAAAFLRRQVTERCDLRYAPMLYFTDDDTLIKAQRLDQLLHASAHGEPEPETMPGDDASPPVDVGRSKQATLAGPAAPPEDPNKPKPRKRRPMGRAGSRPSGKAGRLRQRQRR